MGVIRLNDDDLTSAAVRARALLIIEDDAPIRRALRNALGDVTDRLLEADRRIVQPLSGRSCGSRAA